MQATSRSKGAAALVLVFSLPWPIDGGERERREALQEVRRDLSASNAKTRRGAIGRAAELGGGEGWELVLEALVDPDAEVGDAAELALGSMAHADTRELLFGKAGLRAREERAVLRAAETFGRMREMEVEPLRRALRSAKGEVARRLAWSIERAALARELEGETQNLVSDLERLAHSSDTGRARATALWALAALDRERAGSLALTLARERDADLRCAALGVASEIDAQAGLDLARKLAADADLSVRTQALAAFESAACREGVLQLCGRLAVEERSRLRWRIVEALRRLSGLKHKDDAERWRRWAAELPSNWSPRLAPAAEPAVEEAAETTAAVLAGLELRSDRLAFLVDFSGSMWQERSGGRTVKEQVDTELVRAIQALPETALFNLIPYANEPRPWQPRSVPATKANKSKAIEAFVQCKLRGRGNLYDAILCALEDPELDTLVVWSDGVPTGGLHSALDLVVPLVLEQNRCARVAFDLVLVDAPRGALRRFERLADESGGELVTFELEGQPSRR